MMNSIRLFGISVLATAAVLAADVRAPRLTTGMNIPLWERGQVPLAKGDGPLDSPFLTVFLPSDEKRNGSSAIIAPGGSNIMLMYGLEGIDIAERYNDWGTAAFVLTYRLSPRYGEDARILDGNRAIQILRAHAAEWKLDASKIGFAGFSAGSSMARAVAANARPADANATDAISRVASRPDYLLLVYGPGRAGASEKLSEFPPSFLLSAAADRGAAAGTVQLFQDLQKAGAVAELYIIQKGRHGFGAGNGSPEYSLWMDWLKHFLVQGGFLPGGSK